MFTVSNDWKKAYPGAFVGALAMSGVTNPETHAGLERLKEELVQDLRALFKNPEELKSSPTIKAYKDYYKRFKKTYHVLQQLQSVIFKGKSIPKVAALVEAMFMAELRDMLLTAGHDLDLVKLPVRLDTAKGVETFTRIDGQDQLLKAGDMIIADQEAVISSVIYGPDKRTRIGESTTRALFTAYGVPGIGALAVRQHLDGIKRNVLLISPDATVELMEVYSAD
ncbi:phenylalanine--tRNA ligase beta subunit-related protein [Thermodesulfobacteriota bacterium]